MEHTDVLMIEDDVSLAEVTRDFLEDQGLKVALAQSGSMALEWLAHHSCKLIVLDINLPDLIGFELCSIIRETSKVPILFLSARISDRDKITGLELGGDDYISKPYSLHELLSRIKAHIRRKYDYDTVAPNENREEPVRIDRLEVYLSARRIFVSGVEKELPAKEFDLLACLLNHRNKTVAKETLINEVWGADYQGELTTLSVHIRRLREKIEKDPSNPGLIKTVWSVGFRFEG